MKFKSAGFCGASGQQELKMSKKSNKYMKTFVNIGKEKKTLVK